jgi:ferritin-like metal-binding protein YciE
MEQLQELLVEELRDIYDAEKQLVRALPKMAKAASNPELRQAFTEHLEVTRNQVARVEQCFEVLGERAKSKPCKAMKGLVEEAQEHIQEHEKGELLDQVLIASAQKVEHYEIAAYGTGRAIAKSLGAKEAMGLLQETLREEEATDKLLTQIALRAQREMGRAKPAMEEQEEGGGRGRGGSRGGGSGGAKAAGGSGGRGGAKKKVAAQRNSGGSERKSGGARSGGGGAAQKRASSSSGGRSGGGSSASSRILTDVEEIRQWAEERQAKPACVRGTGDKGDIGILRLDFPGYTGEDKLEEISWEEWGEKFQERKLALLVQDQTAQGAQSNFNKIVSQETAAEAGSGGGGRGRGGARGKKAAGSSGKRAGGGR